MTKCAKIQVLHKLTTEKNKEKILALIITNLILIFQERDCVSTGKKNDSGQVSLTTLLDVIKIGSEVMKWWRHTSLFNTKQKNTNR